MIVRNFNLHSSPPTSRSSLYLGRTILCIIALKLGACGCGNPLRDSFKDITSTTRRDIHDSLRTAVRDGDIAEVKKLLEEDDVNVNKKDSLGHTLLKEAIESGNKEVVRILLEKRANPNAISDYWGTPLEHLTEGHRTINTEIPKLLLDHGADPNGQDKYGKTFLQRAISNNQTEMVQLLLEANGTKFDKNKVTSWACDKGDAGMIKFLLDKKIITGVDLNKTDSYGCTLLLRAIDKGDEELVKLLLQVQGIEVNKPDKYGNTPLNQAINKGSKEMVKLLLQVKGIKVNKLRNGSNSDTPLIQAINKDNRDIIELFLKHSTTKIDKAHPGNGNTPLHVAVKQGKRKTIKMLINKGADSAIANNAGSIPAQMTNNQQLSTFVNTAARARNVETGG